MSPTSKRRIEIILPMEEAGSFLKKLGEEMEQGSLTLGATRIDLKNFKSFGVSFKEEGEALRIKLKVKYPQEELPAASGPAEAAAPVAADKAEPGDTSVEDDAAAAVEGPNAATVEEKSLPAQTAKAPVSAAAPRRKPSYKSLKKRMKGQFKSLKEAAEQGVMPGGLLVEAFARDSELMVTFRGKGEEYYAGYKDALQAFRKAISEDDAEAFRASVEGLDRSMKVCHDKYK